MVIGLLQWTARVRGGRQYPEAHRDIASRRGHLGVIEMEWLAVVIGLDGRLDASI